MVIIACLYGKRLPQGDGGPATRHALVASCRNARKM
jgi:hypothetical protein